MKYFLIFLVLAAALGIVLRMAAHTSSTPSLPTKTVMVGDTTVVAEVAGTEAQREQGLSGRTGLAPGVGMLFVFAQPGRYGFWMKDMRFAIDMVFAAADGTVVTVVANASPESYYQTPPEVFYPTGSVLYVLELPAGFAAQHSIAEGTKLVVQ